MSKLKWKNLTPEQIAAAKLFELTPKLARLASAIISDCASKGLYLTIEPTYGGKRTDNEQIEVSTGGGSKTKNRSNHQFSRFPDRLSHAVDFVKYKKDASGKVVNFDWNFSLREKLLLASSALAHDLGSGLCFGLSTPDKIRVKDVISKCRAAKWPKDNSFYGQFGKLHLGFDPYHVQDIYNWDK